MNINRINSQKGIAQFLVIAVMALMALGIPTATKLVQQNQENRSKAASGYTSIGGTVTGIKQDEACGLVKFEELTPTTDKDNPSLLCKTGLVWQYHLSKPTCNGFSCDKLPPSLSKPYYSWYCVTGVDPGLDLTDANVKQQISDLKGKVVNCRSTSTTIVQENPKCGPANGQAINEYPSKEKLCAIGTPSEVSLNRTTMAYSWQCKLGDKKVSCSSNTKPNTIQTTQITTEIVEEIVPIATTEEETVPEIGGEAETERASKNSEPKIGNNTQIPASSIKISPTSLKLKVGQSKNLTSILTPSNSTDKVAWQSSNGSLATIKIVTLKCSATTVATDGSNTKCIDAPGTNHSQVTALKPGTVKIKAMTNNGKTAEVMVVITDEITPTPLPITSTPIPRPTRVPTAPPITPTQTPIGEIGDIINGSCGSVKYSDLTETSDKDKPELLCKSGKVADFGKLTYRCLNTEPNCPPPYYSWKCLGSNGGKSVQCKKSAPTAPTTPTPTPIAKITLSTKACEGSIVGFKPGITQTAWSDEKTLIVKAKISTYCGGATISNPSYKLNDNKLILGYRLTIGNVVTNCVCPRELTFVIKNLPKKEYEVSVAEPDIIHDTKIPATSIRISPLGLSLKVGQNRNLTYILSPGSSTDTVKWSTTGSGQIRIQKITLKCADSPNAKCIDVPGINNLLVTGLKAGTVKIKLTTSSGKTAQATVVVQK